MSDEVPTFQCSSCGCVFECGWSEEEALAEQKANGFDDVPCDVVCDDCYHGIVNFVRRTVAEVIAKKVVQELFGDYEGRTR
jgi:rubredoxin